MLIAVWIVSGILALAYLGVGLMKLASPKEKMPPQMAWVEDFSPIQVKLIGTVEVLGAIGVILPALTGIAPMLTPVAAACLVLVQLVAVVVHLRRGERMILPNVVLLVLALFVALARFGVFGAL